MPLIQPLLNFLQAAVFKRPAFTWAAIAGDMVILHAMAEAGLLQKVPVIFIDTLHLFPETTELLRAVEKQYGFEAARAQQPAPPPFIAARRHFAAPVPHYYRRQRFPVFQIPGFP